MNSHWRLLAESYGRGTAELTCEDPIGHAVIGCIEGSCGDGTCEIGERGPCGCTLDCPAEEQPEG